MLNWLLENWINIVILGIVLIGFGAAVRYQRKINKAGGCAGCSGGAGCSKCAGRKELK